MTVHVDEEIWLGTADTEGKALRICSPNDVDVVPYWLMSTKLNVTFELTQTNK